MAKYGTLYACFIISHAQNGLANTAANHDGGQDYDRNHTPAYMHTDHRRGTIHRLDYFEGLLPLSFPLALQLPSDCRPNKHLIELIRCLVLVKLFHFLSDTSTWRGTKLVPGLPKNALIHATVAIDAAKLLCLHLGVRVQRGFRYLEADRLVACILDSFSDGGVCGACFLYAAVHFGLEEILTWM